MGRVGERCVFAPLGRDELARIVQMLIHESSQQLQKERQITYEVSPEVLGFLIDKSGSDPTLGACPLRRAVQRVCELAIARAVLRGETQPGDHLVLRMWEGELVVLRAIG